MVLRSSSCARHILVLFSMLLAVSLAPRDASACGETLDATPYVTLDTITAIGADTNMPADSVLAITGKGWNPGGDPADAWLTNLSLAQHLKVLVTRESTGELIPGSVVAWSEKGVVWRPEESFWATTHYVAQVSLDAFQPPAPDGAAGDLSRTIVFKVGDVVLDPIQLKDEPSLSVTTTGVEYCPPTNANDCGGCTKYETKLRRVLTVTVPGIKGGLPSLGRKVRVMVANDSSLKEGTVNLSDAALATDTDASTTFSLPLPVEKKAYGVCVIIEVADANTTTIETNKKCLPDTEVWPDAFNEGGAGSAGSGGSLTMPDDPAMGMSNNVLEEEDGLCSMSHQPARASGLFASLAIVAATMLRRERRRNRA